MMLFFSQMNNGKERRRKKSRKIYIVEDTKIDKSFVVTIKFISFSSFSQSSDMRYTRYVARKMPPAFSKRLSIFGMNKVMLDF
jgi:hypothetical protein